MALRYLLLLVRPLLAFLLVLLVCLLGGCREKPQSPLRILRGYIVCYDYSDGFMHFVPTKEDICGTPIPAFITENLATGFKFKLNDRVAHDVYFLQGDTIPIRFVRFDKKIVSKQVIVAPARVLVEMNAAGMDLPRGLPDQEEFVIRTPTDTISFIYRHRPIDVLKIDQLPCNNEEV